MKLHREWVTPVVGGAFLLLAVTGVLMFFHLDTGLNKLAHEWLGWVLVAAVGLHLTLNARPLVNVLKKPRGQVLAGLFVAVLAASFLPLGNEGGGKASFMAVTRALADAPLPVVAQVAGISEPELSARLTAAGYPPSDASASISALVGPDMGASVGVLASVLNSAPSKASAR